MGSSRRRGILKPSDGDAHGGMPAAAGKQLHWNEANLAESEANRSATMRIDEPKTPFVHYIKDYTDDEDDDDRDAPAAAHVSMATPSAAAISVPHSRASHLGPPSMLNLDGRNGRVTNQSCASMDDDSDGDTPSHRLQRPAAAPANDWSDSEGLSSADGAGGGSEHERFERMRKEHYKMAEAIRKGRRLVQSESEGGDEGGPLDACGGAS